MSELITFVSIGIIALFVGFLACFGFLYLILKDMLIVPLKHVISVNKSNKIETIFRYEDGTNVRTWYDKVKATDEGIFAPWDREKKYPITYVQHNDRNSVNMPIAHIFQGLSFTPQIGERYEQSVTPDGRLVYEGYVGNGEQKRKVEVALHAKQQVPNGLEPKMTRVVGLGASNKKISELNSSNVIVSHALGKASAIKQLYEDIKQSPFLLPAIIIVGIVCVVTLAIVYNMTEQLTELMSEYKSYKPLIDKALEQSTIQTG